MLKCAGTQFGPELARLFVEQATPELLRQAQALGPGAELGPQAALDEA